MKGKTGELKIVSREQGTFRDRTEAGFLLADELSGYREKDPVVLGIPMGGVITAGAIAEKLDSDMDIVLSGKIGAPSNPELALGAVSEKGDIYINSEIAEREGVTQGYIQEKKKEIIEEIQRRAKLFRKYLPGVPLEARTVIVTDDGVATGSTIRASLWSLRHENPDELIVALPVGAEKRLQELTGEADRVICLRSAEPFYSVGQFYRDFSPVDDDRVIGILNKYRDTGI